VRTPDTQRASGKRRGWLFLILGSALDEYGPRTKDSLNFKKKTVAGTFNFLAFIQYRNARKLRRELQQQDCPAALQTELRDSQLS
jgi:hypothetical protein